MNLQPIVYIAGPFRAPTPFAVAENVRAAERMGLAVARAGGMPLIPHANTGLFDGQLTAQFWITGTAELLRRSDAAIFLRTWETSEGSKLEKRLCDADDIPYLIEKNNQPEAHPPSPMVDYVLEDFIKRLQKLDKRICNRVINKG